MVCKRFSFPPKLGPRITRGFHAIVGWPRPGRPCPGERKEAAASGRNSATRVLHFVAHGVNRAPSLWQQQHIDRTLPPTTTTPLLAT